MAVVRAADTDPMTHDTEKELQELLDELEEEEREISLRRSRLHDRLALYPEYGDGDLGEAERELSARRRELHARIDAIRAERSSARASE
jgi:anti-sigma-K factor RsiG